MNFIRLLPVILGLLLLGAHFYRAGELVFIVLCLLALGLLFIRQSWVPRLVQVLLLLGAIEWLITLYHIAVVRIHMNMPWTRMAVILGAVALFTALSGLMFERKALRARYRTERS